MAEPYLFINYRKNDAIVLAESLSTKVRGAFGDVVFLDDSEMESGEDFTASIAQALEKATCMLVILGQSWLHQHDRDSGMRRIDMPDDWVRREIETGIARNIVLIPIIAPNAEMPHKKYLPIQIQALSDRKPIKLHSHQYIAGLDALIDSLEKQHGFVPIKKVVQVPAAVQAGDFNFTADRETRASSDQARKRGPKTWINGTTLHYYLFEPAAGGKRKARKPSKAWNGRPEDIAAVREAIRNWQEVGLGIQFKEVDDLNDAEIRIGFEQTDGSWSFVGRDALNVDPRERTVNFGSPLDTPFGRDTALHEIGHVLGLAEEHRNPNSGLEWDEKAVHRYFSGPPNYWSRETIENNILRKGDPDWYPGSWDPNSIMHFPFPAGLIAAPPEYQGGLEPEPGLSQGDIEKIRFLYPPLSLVIPELVPFDTVQLQIQHGEQANFAIRPKERRTYRFQSFGKAEVVMMLFEKTGHGPQWVNGDDNSGRDEPASFEQELSDGRDYVLRVRLFGREGKTALMMS